MRPLTAAALIAAAPLLACAARDAGRPAAVVEQAGTVVQVGRFGYGIVPDADPGTRYAPEGDLAAELRVDGLRVLFAGVVVSPPPGVRQWGTPFRISSIRRAPAQAP